MAVFRLFEHCGRYGKASFFYIFLTLGYGKASSVAALPYDVVTREEAKMIGDKNPD